ncbi:MAG: hypothetical protein A2Y14_04300 [Verrucomicrobia bacterium GWF2_51_19]|nr:MAG: hypothetical protein A2Y14_04300 [Verrucomicrobia bacterium GWF2_51_19]HCJ12226.1 hypothetical protein [Opitutae bacterium]
MSYADGENPDQLNALKARVAALESQMSATPAQKDAAKGAMSSLYNIDFYGYVKADAIWSGQKTDTDGAGNYVLGGTAANQELYNRNQFTMTANQTRFGFNIKGPDALDGKLTANIECDFWGKDDSTDTDTGNLRLRHAYATWKSGDWSVWAGQTWALLKGVGSVSTINFNCGIKEGELANMRLPQIGVGKAWKAGDVAINTKLSINKPTGGTTANASSGVPHIHAYIDSQFKMLTSKLTKISLSGVLGAEKEPTSTSLHKRYNVCGALAGLELPIVDWLTITGQIYYGKNLGQYGSGSGIGFASSMNTTDHKDIRELGGFGQIRLFPIDKLTINAGIGCAAPKYLDVVAAADQATTTAYRNAIIFANVNYDFTKALSAGLEYAYLKTWYRGVTEATDTTRNTSRLQAAVTFKF